MLKQIFQHVENTNVKVVEVFFTVDTDGSGELDLYEFEEALNRMGIALDIADIKLAFKDLDEDGSGDIAIDEFMSRMRAEKKWRERATLKKSRKNQQNEDVVRAVLAAESVDERTEILEVAAKTMWDMSVMKASLRIWGENVTDWEGMDTDEKQFRQMEMEAAKLEMAADKEEAEAVEAEAMYDKEELEAQAAEAALKKEEEEAEEAIEDAKREEEEAAAAIARADREEKEAIQAERDAQVELEEAEVAKLNYEREKAESDAAMAVAEKELADVRAVESDLTAALAKLDAAETAGDGRLRRG